MDDAKPSTLSPSEMTTYPTLKTWCAGGGGNRTRSGRVPVAFRSHSGTSVNTSQARSICDVIKERVRSIFAGVNATRTSGTGPEREPEQV